MEGRDVAHEPIASRPITRPGSRRSLASPSPTGSRAIEAARRAWCRPTADLNQSLKELPTWTTRLGHPPVLEQFMRFEKRAALEAQRCLSHGLLHRSSAVAGRVASPPLQYRRIRRRYPPRPEER